MPYLYREPSRLRPITGEGDYSYSMTKIVDDRLMLIGDAGRFVDPIFSTGVSIALNSARFAYPDVLRAMETGDFRAQAFRPFEETTRRGTRNWHEFITVYYRLNVSMRCLRPKGRAVPQGRNTFLRRARGEAGSEGRYPLSRANWAKMPVELSPTEPIIGGWQVMQEWEGPLMDVLASEVTRSGGDVLEVGFGMGMPRRSWTRGVPVIRSSRRTQ